MTYVGPGGPVYCSCTCLLFLLLPTAPACCFRNLCNLWMLSFLDAVDPQTKLIIESNYLRSPVRKTTRFLQQLR
jgi:hypothetical protein